MASKNKKLTSQVIEQRKQEREIRSLLFNIGFSRIDGVDGKEFNFDGRTTEMDDLFIYENIIVLTEYTVGDPKDHLLKKSFFYEKVKDKPESFIKFLIENETFKNFNEIYNKKIKNTYTIKQLQVVILYCSKKNIPLEHRNLVNNIIYFDYNIVKYFESLAKVIKKSTRYEFFDFLKIPHNKIAGQINNPKSTNHQFCGHILPEEHSSFKEGYKIVSFYIDAKNLLKRAYVLRQNGWKEKQNIGHYQRMLIGSKISKMRKYLHTNERVFINNIIATLSSDKIKLYDENDNLINIDQNGNFETDHTFVTPTKIEISDEVNILGIIDGQHRTYAYHEGNDSYEKTIEKLRNVQNLLVTGILFPSNERLEKKLKFEANLFMEINANQSGATSQLKQEIESMINPFSSISISKRVLDKLNQNGPLANLLEEYWYEKGKLKTSSIVTYALKPLLKLNSEKNSDSLFKIWENENKNKLKNKESEEYELLNEYIEFSSNKILNFLLLFKLELSKYNMWRHDKNDDSAILSVTMVNGMLNTLRLCIEHNENIDKNLQNKLKNIHQFDFKSYKSSQFSRMAHHIYDEYFKN